MPVLSCGSLHTDNVAWVDEGCRCRCFLAVLCTPMMLRGSMRIVDVDAFLRFSPELALRALCLHTFLPHPVDHRGPFTGRLVHHRFRSDHLDVDRPAGPVDD